MSHPRPARALFVFLMLVGLQPWGATLQATRVFCVVHCDPVTDVAFPQVFQRLTELVAAADEMGMRLSIHWTGSFADQAFKAGKRSIVAQWLRRGHGMGAHVHPEFAQADGSWPQPGWLALPQDMVDQAMDDATRAVNKLVGQQANLVLDTLLPFYASPARFPKQYSHFAWGNNGHDRPVPIFPGGERRLTAVFYRTLPGDPSVDALHFTAARLFRELESCHPGSAYGPVLHPTDFQGATRSELLSFFRQASQGGYRSIRVQDLKATGGNDQDQALRLRLTATMPDAGTRAVTIDLIHRGSRALRGAALRVHLPVDFPEVDTSRSSPRSTTHDRERGLLSFLDLELLPGQTKAFTLYLSQAAQPVGHPIAAVVDAYLEGDGLSSRWACMTLAGTPAQGYFLPFESYNPQGRRLTDEGRRAQTPQTSGTADRALRVFYSESSPLERLKALQGHGLAARERLQRLMEIIRAALSTQGPEQVDRWAPPAAVQRAEGLVKEGREQEAQAAIDAIVEAGLTALGPAPSQGTVPSAFFAVHFEPRSADERGFEALKKFIEMAKSFKVLLTLQFTPSWAKMILADKQKLALLRQWQTAGHEIAAHHHGATHGWEWDGYTNLSTDRWQAQRREVYARSGPDKKAVQEQVKRDGLGEKFFGNMKDYMSLYRKLSGPQGIATMTMGPDRETDWPQGVPYSLDNIVLLPNGDYQIAGTAIVKLKDVVYSGQPVKEIDMRFIENANEVAKAREEYARAKADDGVGVVTHIEDFARDPGVPRSWMEFINQQDPSGAGNQTVAQVMAKLAKR